MLTVEAIFDAYGGPAALARAIGVTTEHAASMRRRKSIPVRYWPALLDVAQTRPALRHITSEALVAVSAARRRTRRDDPIPEMATG
jgi:hypothetical protein